MATDPDTTHVAPTLWHRIPARTWARFRDPIATAPRNDASVEADVMRKLYGDPNSRRLAHDTSRQSR